MEPDLLEAVNKSLEDYFGHKVTISDIQFLSEPDRRNRIARLFLSLNNSDTQSVIFKQSLSDKSQESEAEDILARFARDFAGLKFLNNLKTATPIAPKFYGGSIQHRFILIEDFGSVHTSLVDSLMGQDRNAAEAALTRYMKVMAALHGNTHIACHSYHEIIQKLNPGAPIWQDDFDDMLIKISALLKKFNIPIDDDLNNEIRYVLNLAKEPGPFTGLMHGDICPDNVFDYPIQNKMRIIDFEWSFMGNVLLDAVSLRMCMPTCWCVKAFPEDVVELFEQIYREELIKYIPAASDGAVYYEHYVAACAYWMLWRVVSLDDSLETDIDIHDQKFPLHHPLWKPEYNLRRPRSLYRFKAFIKVSERHDVFPHLRAMAKSVLQELKKRWPDVAPLDLYTAFRN